MLMSMTGYGRGCFKADSRTYYIEMKSVNQRYLDVQVRVPKQFSFLEDIVRGYIGKHISRGKVDIFINIENYQNGNKSVMLDKGLVEAYLKSLNILKDEYNLKGDISLDIVSTLPDILKVEKLSEDEEKVWQEIKPAIDEALECLINMRTSEGIELKNCITEYCQKILKQLAEIELRAPQMVDKYRQKLQDRLNDFINNGVIDESRIAAEAAIYAEKCNIDEEIVRLHSHLNQMEKFLHSEQPVGRKLDFLLQEINREANTIASKSVDFDITTNIIEIKSDIEKIREQLQNIE